MDTYMRRASLAIAQLVGGAAATQVALYQASKRKLFNDAEYEVKEKDKEMRAGPRERVKTYARGRQKLRFRRKVPRKRKRLTRIGRRRVNKFKHKRRRK